MRRKTKIVCTLGPSVDSEHQTKQLIEAGMNVARINCSHGDWSQRERWIEWIRKHSRQLAPVAILVDLQGPKFRIGDLPNGELPLRAGEEITVGKSGQIPITQPEILRTLKKGSRVLLGDGDVELRVDTTGNNQFECCSVSGGTVKSRQGVTVVGQSFECEVLTKQDLVDIRKACELGADYIALSYVHSGSDIDLLREKVSHHNAYVRLCAKIETKAALKNIEQIASRSDAVMVARGDLGLQMDIEEVPLAQKRIIQVCREQGRPVITATQMLESMVRAPRPTRAEATDVANAILDGTDAVMLSGETAAGEFPIEAVRYMSRIAEKAETLLSHPPEGGFQSATRNNNIDHTEAVAHGVAQLSELLKPKAIVTSTSSGRTAILVSKFRPSAPIFCAAWNRKVQAQMALVWGVETALVELPRTTDEQIASAVGAFVAQKRLKANDRVIVSAGIPPGTSGNTNLILVHTVKT